MQGARSLRSWLLRDNFLSVVREVEGTGRIDPPLTHFLISVRSLGKGGGIVASVMLVMTLPNPADD